MSARRRWHGATQHERIIGSKPNADCVTRGKLYPGRYTNHIRDEQAFRIAVALGVLPRDSSL